jgi:phosphopantetheinyl transferase (holo-ACP synthase)
MICPAIHHRLWHAPRLDCGEVEANHWLGSGEQEGLANMRDPSRRRDFFAGRILLKRIILDDLVTRGSDVPPYHLAEIEVLSRDGLGRSVQPRIYLRGRQQPWSVSLAHLGSAVLAAVAEGVDIRVGVDLTPRTLGSRYFAETWLARDEQAAWKSTNRPQNLAQIWALKEAVYKAIGRGAPFVPAHIEVLHGASGWTYRYRGDCPKTLTWCEVTSAGNHVAVVVATSQDTKESIP